MNVSDLITLKIELEFGALPDGDLMPPALVNADAQPRLLVSRHRDGFVMLFRRDLPEATCAALRSLGVERAFNDEAEVRSILDTDSQVQSIWRIRWYTFERTPEASEFANVVLRGNRFVIEVDGRPVAQAWDSQSSPAAAEVEVATDPAYQRRGFARQTVAAWAATVREQGRVAYYSHLAENHASAELARSLELTWLSDEVEYL